MSASPDAPSSDIQQVATEVYKALQGIRELTVENLLSSSLNDALEPLHADPDRISPEALYQSLGEIISRFVPSSQAVALQIGFAFIADKYQEQLADLRTIDMRSLTLTDRFNRFAYLVDPKLDSRSLNDRFSSVRQRWDKARRGLAMSLVKALVKELDKEVRTRPTILQTGFDPSMAPPACDGTKSLRTTFHELAAGLPIRLDQEDSATDWRCVLDGSAIPRNVVAAGGFVNRYMLGRNTKSYTAADLARLIQSNPRQLIVIGTDAGQGKSSFLNAMVNYLHEDTWIVRIEPITQQQWTDVDNVAQQLSLAAQVLGDDAQRFVYVYETKIVNDLQPLMFAASNNFCKSGNSTMVVCTNTGVAKSLKRTARVDLTLEAEDFSDDQIEQWAALVIRAASELPEYYKQLQQMDERYPHLSTFLSLPNRAQVELLSDHRDTLIVGLLSAVYGPASQSKLLQELLELPFADGVAYLLICMLSAVGESVPEDVLLLLVPDADLNGRANHNPWVRLSAQHAARHSLIAQTVVEKCSSGAEAMRLVNTLVNELFNKACYDDDVLEVLRKTQNALLQLRPLDQQDHAAMLNAWWRYSRLCILRSMAPLEEAILRHYRDDYRSLEDWANILYRLAPGESRGDKYTSFLQAAERMLDLAAANQGNDRPERAWLRHCQVRYARERAAENLGRQTYEDLVADVRPFLGASWMPVGLLVDAFFWAENAIQSYPFVIDSGFDVSALTDDYRVLFEAYQRARAPHVLLQIVPNTMKKMTTLWRGHATSLVHKRLGEHAITALWQSDWLVSRELNNPDFAILALCAETVAQLHNAQSASTNEPLPSLDDIHEALAWSVEHHSSWMSLLTLLLYFPDERADYAILFEEDAVTLDDLDKALFQHGKAIIERGPTRKGELLRGAVKEYQRFAAKRHFGFESVSHWWRLALEEMEQLNVTGLNALKARYAVSEGMAVTSFKVR